MDCGVVVWYSDRDANQREVIGCTSGTYNPSLRELSLRQSWAGLNLTVCAMEIPHQPEKSLEGKKQSRSDDTI